MNTENPGICLIAKLLVVAVQWRELKTRILNARHIKLLSTKFSVSNLLTDNKISKECFLKIFTGRQIKIYITSRSA